MRDRSSPECIEWGWAGRALDDGESGDLHVVRASTTGALVALIDGLGHGREAAIAARAAVPILEERSDLPLVEIVRHCHDAMRTTRGAVMSIVSIDAELSSLSWIGVGNVDAVLARAGGAHERPDEALVTRGGVVGFTLPPLRPISLPLAWGDTLILATDGVRSGFTAGVTLNASPSEIAQSILARHAKGTDDAHVLVARYIGVTR